LSQSSSSYYLTLLKTKFREKKSKPFFKGGLGSLVIKFGNTFLQFGVGVALARTLGIEAFGIYTFVYAIIKILAIPTELGLPNLLIRFIAQYHSNKKWGEIKGLLKFTNGVVLVISVLIISISMGLVYGDVIDLSIERRVTFIWGLALLPVIALGNIRGATLRGFKYFIVGLVPESILRHLFFLILLLLFSQIKGAKLSSVDGMFYHFIAAFLSYSFGAYWLFKYLPKQVRKSKSIIETKTWLSVALPFLVIGGLQIVMGRIDIVLIGIISNSKNVGMYEVALKAATLVSFSLSALNFILGPYFSKYFSENNKVRLQKIATVSVLFNTIIAAMISLVMILFGKGLLSFIFGAEFLGGYYSLVILIVAQLISVTSGSVALLLNMSGHEKKVLYVMAFSMTINVILNLIFIPKFGIEGAAFATLASTAVWNIYLSLYCFKKIDVNTSILSIFNIKL